MGGKRISVQMAKHENGNSGGSLVHNRRNDNRRGGVLVAADRRSSYVCQEPSQKIFLISRFSKKASLLFFEPLAHVCYYFF